MKHIPVLIFATVLALTACGGGGDSVAVSDAGGYTVESGVAQKGPLAQGSAIWVNELAVTTYKPNGKQYTFRTTNDFGTFSPSGIKYGTPYLSTLAQGYYYNEITGTQSDDIVLLSGLSQIGAVSNSAADTAINVNVLSSMTVNRIIKLATTSPIRMFAVARAKAQKETLGAFYIYNDASILSGKVDDGVVQPANLTALDLSKSRAADQILAAVSAVVMKAGVNGAGVNVLLSQIANDLEDDGALNNSTNYRTSVQSKLCAAAAVTDFANVATNLNNLYGTTYLATDLSQWVDTSGCVDQVINKYKFSANNIAVGTVSKSPAYKVGDDDVGQCFSVGGVTTGATTGLYYNGSAMSVVGTQLVNANDMVAIGINASTARSYSGFIQRSAPAANGSCPTVVPLNGVTKVAKYTINSVLTAGNRFESTTVGAASGIRDNSTGIVWAAQLAPAADSPGALPAVHELLTLTDAGAAAISTTFPFLVGEEVPVNETLRNLGAEPWVVSFTTNMRGGLRNAEPLAPVAHWRVLQRPTTSTAPAGFEYAGNGTVTQGGTLMWRLCSEGSSHVINTTTCSGAPTSLSMAEAKTLSGSFAGYTGWRLPTKQELQTLLRLSNATGSLLAEPFKSAEQATLASAYVLGYWTSTAASADPVSSVWIVDFSLDYDPGGLALSSVTSQVLPPTALVRLVRNLR